MALPQPRARQLDVVDHPVRREEIPPAIEVLFVQELVTEQIARLGDLRVTCQVLLAGHSNDRHTRDFGRAQIRRQLQRRHVGRHQSDFEVGVFGQVFRAAVGGSQLHIQAGVGLFEIAETAGQPVQREAGHAADMQAAIVAAFHEVHCCIGNQVHRNCHLAVIAYAICGQHRAAGRSLDQLHASPFLDCAQVTADDRVIATEVLCSLAHAA